MRPHGQEHSQEPELLEQLIVEQAVGRAKQAGWTVMPEACYVVGIATDEALRTGETHAWVVYLSAQPPHNPQLQQPIRLECRVEWLGDCLCAVEWREPTERTQRVI